MLWILVLLGLVALCCLGFVFWSMRRRRLPASMARELSLAWRQIEGTVDLHRRVIDAEKILDRALAMLRYRGTFSEKLRVAGPRFSDVEALWHAHKLRNRIAHEVNVSLDAREAERAVAAFKRGLDELM